MCACNVSVLQIFTMGDSAEGKMTLIIITLSIIVIVGVFNVYIIMAPPTLLF